MVLKTVSFVNEKVNPFSTMTRFHIRSVYYFDDFIHLQKLMWRFRIVKTGH
ncbi:hypothetical protein E2C01_062957 [Portunus trituberculatus]|uniref:Uncharacterized protein n=1 Tax=Portunus trituberculatus TaxID=210409 RepID=A0A5B7HG94_PORTR|nr:hypothetical protein [Portunus trituberculatus]